MRVFAAILGAALFILGALIGAIVATLDDTEPATVDVTPATTATTATTTTHGLPCTFEEWQADPTCLEIGS